MCDIQGDIQGDALGDIQGDALGCGAFALQAKWRLRQLNMYLPLRQSLAAAT